MRKIFINKQKMQKSLTTFMTFLLLLCASVAFAQTGTVTGTVADQNGETLIGVNVSVKGTTIGGITDIDGRFSISQVPANAVLVFSYIGYTTQEIPVGNQRSINVRLREDTQGLEELIVVGYGTRKAGEMTGAVATVKAEEIQRLAAVTTSEVLRNVPGVTVMSNNTPGNSPNVIVRGVGTINNANPLWVVDGIPGGNVNPNDIETITVLKDAAAQAIYGTRAANGVILVTTKAGRKNQRTSLSVNIRAGNTRNTNNYRMLNTQEYGEALWLEAKNMGRTNYVHPIYGSGPTPTIPDYIFPNGAMEGDPRTDPKLYDYLTIKEDGTDTYLITRANKEGTDWIKEISRVAIYQQYDVNLSGGGDNTTYAFTLGYLNEEGILKFTGYDRWNFRSSITSDVTKWLQIGQNFSGTYSNQNGHLENNSESSAISWAYRNQPIIPMYDIAGNYAGTRAGGQLGNAQNPLAVLDLNQYDNRERMNLSGSAFIALKPIEGLTLRSAFGMNYNTHFFKNIDYVNKSHAERGTDDYVRMEGDKTRRWVWTNTAEYRKSIGVNDFTLLVGSEAIEERYYRMTAQRYNYVSKDPNYMELSSGIDGQQNGSSQNSWSLFSLFTRLNYVYDNKYIVEGVVRRDGSSRFAAGNRYGVFPAVSVGWVISRESFMASTRSWLNNLKLRGGYGITGNDQMDNNYNSYTVYNFNQNDDSGSFYAITGVNSSAGTLGFRQNRLGNTNVKWETMKTANLAIDAAFLNGFSLSLDVYQRRTTDMLFPKAVPRVMGSASAPSVNVGEMLNTGFDFDFGYRGTGLNRELNYQVSLNISAYKNEIVTLTGNDKEFLDGAGFREQIYTRSMKGHAFPEFYGYTVEGIFQTQAEADAHPKFFGQPDYNKPGHYKFKDMNNDGLINADDRSFIGSPHPKFAGGINFNVEYKGFDINGQFYGTYGNKMTNYVKRWLDFYQFDGGRGYDYLYNSWGSPYLKDNTKAKLPMIDRNTVVQSPSTAFLEDASYLRLRNLQIGYNLGKLVNVPSVNSLRVYVQVTNLFTISKYSGLDPDPSRGTSRDDARNFGIDAGAWPTPRQVLFGLSIGL